MTNDSSFQFVRIGTLIHVILREWDAKRKRAPTTEESAPVRSSPDRSLHYVNAQPARILRSPLKANAFARLPQNDRNSAHPHSPELETTE